MTTNEQRARRLAEDFRSKHGLGDLPVRDLFELVHSTIGVDVLSMDASEAEHGLTMTDPVSGRTVIAVATTPHPMRQRSSIAHELGHVLAGDLDAGAPLLPGERSPQEIRADAFARHLLVPVHALRQRFNRWPGPPTLEALSTVVQEYEVSPQLAAIQLREAGAIDDRTCTGWSGESAGSLAARFGWLNQYRGLAAESRIPRAPQHLMARAVDGYRAGVLGIAELATWYGEDPGQLERQLHEEASPVEDTASDLEAEYWDDDTPLFPGSAS